MEKNQDTIEPLTMLEELDFEDEVFSTGQSGDLSNAKASKVESKSKVESISDSDSGEIIDDEEPNDLEEGEIKDNGPVVSKNSDIACRFFKRGSCLFGSQCQYLHVSDKVYKMFDPIPHKKRNMKIIEPPNFYPPGNFPPSFIPMKTEHENVNPVMHDVPYHRQGEEFESQNVENTWEKGLEQAKLLIQNANLKKKSEDFESKKLYLVPKPDRNERLKGKCFNKKSPENDVSDCDFKRMRLLDEKKANYRVEQRTSQQWSDPWRRSKSPMNKRRLLSGSISPRSRSRKRSYSSTSSGRNRSTSSSFSSSSFDKIYGSRSKKMSPKNEGKHSSSRSISPIRRTKKRNASTELSSHRRKQSRSFSRSPKRRAYESRSRTSSLSSFSDSQVDDKILKEPTKSTHTKSGKNVPQNMATKGKLHWDSDDKTSEMTVSSISCSTASSGCETDDSCCSYSKRNERSPDSSRFSFSHKKNSDKIFSKSHATSLRNQTKILENRSYAQKQNQVATLRTRMPANRIDKNLVPVNAKTMTNCIPKVAASNPEQVKKPAVRTNSYEILSSAALQLCKYQSLANTGFVGNNTQKPKTENLSPKPINTIRDPSEASANKSVDNSLPSEITPKSSNLSKQKIILNLQPKCKKQIKTEIHHKPCIEPRNTVEKDSSSKRLQLLHQLKLIEDAIARKKHSS